MAEICYENETCDPNSRAARRRRMDIRSRYKFVPQHNHFNTPQPNGNQEFISGNKKHMYMSSADRYFGGFQVNHQHDLFQSDATWRYATDGQNKAVMLCNNECPKFGATSVCGRRREMEDAVAIHPSLCRENSSNSWIHFFGLYDGHGCSHVAMSCKDRLHKLVKEELENPLAIIPRQWKEAMERSFSRMDREVIQCNYDHVVPMINMTSCRCELQMPQCESVGSTAVVSIVTPEKVIVANCGDSRAVLSRGGKAVPLSTDHKPDLPAELQRIQSAGGRVIYWDGPRVLGVLAMSRAIGDNFLKPYVSSEPEITVTDRTVEDEFIILASDGLWDVVSNDTACDIVRMCLLNSSGRLVLPQSSAPGVMENVFGEANPDKACSDASTLLTKLALARRSADNVSIVVVDLRRDNLGSSSNLTSQKVFVAGC